MSWRDFFKNGQDITWLLFNKEYVPCQETFNGWNCPIVLFRA